MSQFANPLQRLRSQPVTVGMSLLLFALLLAMVGASATAQGNDNPDAEPTPLNEDDIIASSHEFKILSITGDGDQRQLEIEIPVTQDTFTASGQPNTNFGLDASLRIGFNADPPSAYGAMRTFLQWDVQSFIPSNAIINSAIYQMWVSGATPAGDPPMSVLGCHLSDPWSATSLTWNSTQPNWGSGIGTGSVPSTIGMIQGDITGLVRDWVSGANPNYGVMLQGDVTPQERQRVLYSQNAGNGLYPRLIVDYTVSNDVTPPVATVNGLPTYSKNPFTVSWSGHDNEGNDPNATGIAYYQVQYNVGGGSWVEWINQTTDTSAEFSSGANGETYQFRVRAVDRAGNVQSWDNTPVTQTTIVSNITVQTFTAIILDNEVPDGDRTINLVLSNPVNAALGATDTVILTIVDDGDEQATPISFASAEYTVSEDAGTALVTVTLEVPPLLTATVDFATSDGTAISGVDYEPVSGTLSFAPCVTEQTFTVTILHNDIHDEDRTINLALSNPVNATLGATDTAVLTITDDGDVQTIPVSFNSAEYTVSENAGTALVTVTLDAPPILTATVDFATSDGTAISSTDYEPVSGTLTFAPGVTEQTFTVTILDNDTPDGDRTINLALSNPVNATLGTIDTAILTIVDDGDVYTILLPVILKP